jgi:hypothetical protein
MSAADSSKILSLIVFGRNDDYQGNFLYRLASCVNFAARQLVRIGRLKDVELLVTDWGSEVPLAQVLPLSIEAREICRFVYVPPDVARGIKPDGTIFASAALNAGLRRAKGEYCALFDADSLFPAFSFRALFDLLEGRAVIPFDIKRTLFFLNRHHIPWEMVQAEPSVKEWEQYLLLHAGALPADFPNSGAGGCGAGHLAHRSIWEELQGYHEGLKGAGWGDVELMLRGTQRYPFFDVGGCGVQLFHMEHWPRNRRGNYGANVLNPYVVSSSIAVNDDGWGLAKFSLEIQQTSEEPKIMGFKKVISDFPKDEEFQGLFQKEEIQNCVREYLRTVDSLREYEVQAKIDDPVDVELLQWLVWHAFTYMPRVFYSYGVLSVHPIGAVIQGCPDVTVYTAYDWKESEGAVWSPVSRMSLLMRQMDYRGYAQHLTGDPSTALRRLKGLSKDAPVIGLAVVNDFIAVEDTVRELKELAPLMGNKSMIMLVCEDAQRLQDVLAGAVLNLRMIVLRGGCRAVFLKD